MRMFILIFLIPTFFLKGQIPIHMNITLKGKNLIIEYKNKNNFNVFFTNHPFNLNLFKINKKDKKPIALLFDSISKDTFNYTPIDSFVYNSNKNNKIELLRKSFTKKIDSVRAIYGMSSYFTSDLKINDDIDWYYYGYTFIDANSTTKKVFSLEKLDKGIYAIYYLPKSKYLKKQLNMNYHLMRTFNISKYPFYQYIDSDLKFQNKIIEIK